MTCLDVRFCQTEYCNLESKIQAGEGAGFLMCGV